MEILISNEELVMACLCIFLILLAISICIEIMIKSSGKLRKSIIFFFVAFIPFLFYIIGRIIDIEARFTAGKFLSLTFNTFTAIFILIGLITMNKLLGDISKEEENTCEPKKIHPELKKEIEFLISAAKKFKKWALLQKNPKFSGSRKMFINWIGKGGYGKNEKEICERLKITKEDFTNIFNKYEKI